MADIWESVQTAIYAALRGAPPALSCPVYDFVPQNAAFPYVTFDVTEHVAADYIGERMDAVWLYMSVWSRERGKKQAAGILAELQALLHRKRFELSSGRMVMAWVMRTRIAPDSDGITHQGSIVLKVLTEE